jgi:hypothetical protein
VIAMRSSVWLAIALALVASGCADPLPPEVLGSVAMTGVTSGDWTLAPTACWNGDTRDFFGVDLVAGDATLRLLQHPTLGWTTTVTAHGDPSTPDARFAPSDCAVFDADLQYDPLTRGYCSKSSCDEDEDDSTQTGHVALDCAWPGGGRIAGRVEFEYCNNPEEGT